jgi:general secretion pathway protein A
MIAVDCSPPSGVAAMDCAHWGLSYAPFRSCGDGLLFHAIESGEEALARLHFLVEERRRFALVAGISGTGKSTLLVRFAGELRRGGAAVALANLTHVEPRELVWELAIGLGAMAEESAPLFRQWRILGDRLAELRYEQRAAVVLFDELGQASSDALGIVTRLVNFAPGSPLPLTVVAAANSDAIARLGRRLSDIADLRVELPAWTLAETTDYLQTALQTAGARQTIFETDAIAGIQQASAGIPRRINQIADLALLAGAAQALGSIDSQTIEAVCGELGFHANDGRAAFSGDLGAIAPTGAAYQPS